MGILEEMLLQNRLIHHNDDGTSSYIESAVLGGNLTVQNSDGLVTHRVERSVYGDELILVNVHTNMVEERLPASAW